jgi:hypothetical protein
MVHEPEDLEERAEPLIRGAGLVEIRGELCDAGSVAVGERSLRFGRGLLHGDAVALRLQLVLEEPGLLVRCLEPVLELGQTALEFGPGRRGRRGAIRGGGRLSGGDLQVSS